MFGIATGLMFSKKLIDSAMILCLRKEVLVNLHMFFVFYPIDVLFLNSNKIVVELKKDFRPFTFYSSKNKAIYIVELPLGAIEKTNTTIGDIIDF